MTALRTGVISRGAVVSQHVFCASLVAWLVVSQGIATTVTYGQSRAAHRYYHSEAPPGAIGRAQRLRGGPSRGFLQPVRIKAPAGALIAPAESGSFNQAQPGVLDVGLLVGLPYRIRISNIPLMEDVAVYPTIELLDRTYPPAELRWKYPIPIELTLEELRLAAEGKLVVRVVYIEDPATPLPSSDAADPGQRYFEVFSDEDPLHVADELGRPVALVRIGSRTPSLTGPTEDFCFGSPPFELNPKRDGQMPAGRPFAWEDSHAAADGERPRHPESLLRQATARNALREARPMNRRVYVDRNRSGNTDPWWFVLIALSTLVLCSCRGLNQDPPPSPTMGNGLSTEISRVADRHESPPAPTRLGQVVRRQSTAVERSLGLFARQPAATGPGIPPCPARDCCADGFCLAQPAEAACVPCGESAIHPRDEYLCDGGDASPAVRVDGDWNVRGLAAEDTIAHFDTLDGRVEVRASNRVCLYAPRFAATRKIIGIAQRELALEASGVVDSIAAVGLAETEPPEAIKQQQSTVRQVGMQISHALEDRQRGLLVDDVDQLREAAGQLLPFEDLQIIRLGVFDTSEQVQLTEGMAAAVVWSAVQAPQVVLDGKLAASQTRVSQPQETLQYLSADESQLRLIKIASRRDAQPGDMVEFTLRFDNVGDEVIGNVTVIDNLTTRLAYVADSQHCSLQAEFLGDANRADSLTLQWQLAEPLEPGQGGIIRFQCRVK